VQKKGYFGNEIISIENNQIVRRFPIYNDRYKETGKQMVIKYNLDKNLKWIEKN